MWAFPLNQARYNFCSCTYEFSTLLFSLTKHSGFWNYRRKEYGPVCQQMVTADNSFSASKKMQMSISSRDFFSMDFEILIVQLGKKKSWKIRALRTCVIHHLPEKNIPNLESCWFNPQIPHWNSLPLARELTLKCKIEAGEGLGHVWTLTVTWQMLFTQQALAPCWRILSWAHCLPLALQEGWRGNNRHFGKIIMGSKI